VTTCASAMLACGDSALFGLGLGGAASGERIIRTVKRKRMVIVIGFRCHCSHGGESAAGHSQRRYCGHPRLALGPFRYMGLRDAKAHCAYVPRDGEGLSCEV